MLRIKDQIKRGFLQLKQDLIDFYKGILAIIVYMVVTHIIFGNSCLSMVLTGIPCPGCGLTRAGIAFFTLHWKAAWHNNCVIFLIVPFIIYLIICRYLLQCKCRWVTPGFVIIGICLIGLYGYRMIHFFPDTSPMLYHEPNIYHGLVEFIRNLLDNF